MTALLLTCTVFMLITLTLWILGGVIARRDAEERMSNGHEEDLRALLLIRGHRLSKAQRAGAELWIARRVVEREESDTVRELRRRIAQLEDRLSNPRTEYLRNKGRPNEKA